MNHSVVPVKEPEDMAALLTYTKVNLTSAINEVVGYVALAEKVVHVAVGLIGPVVVPALPPGAKIVGIQSHVTAAYPSSSVLKVGDHSGTSGALVANSIFNGAAAIVLTATGDTQAPVFATPLGDLSITVTGGDGSTGASTIIIKYIDA